LYLVKNRSKKNSLRGGGYTNIKKRLVKERGKEDEGKSHLLSPEREGKHKKKGNWAPEKERSVIEGETIMRLLSTPGVEVAPKI